MNAAIGAEDRLTTVDQVHARGFDDELIILDLPGGDYYALDAVGAFIWAGLVRGETPGEVAHRLVMNYEVEYASAVNDCVRLANELVVRRLLQRGRP